MREKSRLEGTFQDLPQVLSASLSLQGRRLQSLPGWWGGCPHRKMISPYVHPNLSYFSFCPESLILLPCTSMQSLIWAPFCCPCGLWRCPWLPKSHTLGQDQSPVLYNEADQMSHYFLLFCKDLAVARGNFGICRLCSLFFYLFPEVWVSCKWGKGFAIFQFNDDLICVEHSKEKLNLRLP